MLRGGGRESKRSWAPWVAGAALVGGVALIEAARRGALGERVQHTLGTLAVQAKEFVSSIAPGGHETAATAATEMQPPGFVAGTEGEVPEPRQDDGGGAEGRLQQ